MLLPWALLLAAAVVVTLGVGAQGADYPTPFALSGMYGLVAGAELLVLVVVVPVASRGERRVGLLGLVVLWAMAAPVVAVAWWVSDGDGSSVGWSQVYLLAVAAAVGGYLRVDGAGRLRAWYWLVLGLLGAGAPLLAFVVGDQFEAELTWLYALSPFWVLARIGGPWCFAWGWAAPFAGVAVVAAVLWLVPVSRAEAPEPGAY